MRLPGHSPLTTHHSPLTTRHYPWLLAAIILLAIAVRVWGIAFGLPNLYHPDENIYVDIAQTMFKTGDWNPHFFQYPSLFLYLNALAYYPYYAIGWLTGAFASPADIPGPSMLMMGVGLSQDPGTFLLGRYLTLAFGVGAVVLTFMIGKRLTGNTFTGLFAAALTAVSSTAVIHSRFITPDTILLFFILLSFLGATLIYTEGKTAHYVLAGVAIGLAASAKYNGALIISTLIAAHFLRHGIAGWKDIRLYGAMALSGIAFFATNPFALLDLPTFLDGVRYQSDIYLSGHPGMDGNTLYWYLVYLWSTEGLIALLALFEVIRGISTRSKPIILLSVFPLLYFAFINGFTVRNDRTLLPLLPFLFLLGSSFLLESVRFTNNLPLAVRRLSLIITTIVAAFALIFPFQQMILNTNIRLEGIQTREQAAAWIGNNLPDGSRIALESYAPYVDPTRFTVQPFGSLIEHTPAWYESSAFDYLIFSEGMFGRYYHEASRFPDEVQQYDDLFNTFKQIQTFPDERFEIRIYQIAR